MHLQYSVARIVRAIAPCEYDLHLREYLGRLPTDLVLRAVVADERCAQLVLRWVAEYAPDVDKLFPAESDIGLFGNLPSELLSEVISLLTIQAKVRFAQTCREMHMYAAFLAEQDSRTLMTRFGLPFAHVRFLLLASPTLIAGAAIPWLIFSRNRPDIRTLDFYTGAGTGDLVRKYLARVSADYTFDAAATVEGQCWTKTVLRSGVRQLRVFESSSTVLSALLITSATTSGMGYMDGTAIRHAYPKPMDDQVAITTPRQLPLPTTIQDQREAWAILHEVVDQGFSIKFQLPIAHKCGADTSCPATLRHTEDEGWMSIRLPDVHYGLQCPKKGCTWSLFASGCKSGILKGGEFSTTVDEEDSFWYKVVNKLLLRDTNPKMLIRS